MGLIESRARDSGISCAARWSLPLRDRPGDDDDNAARPVAPILQAQWSARARAERRPALKVLQGFCWIRSQVLAPLRRRRALRLYRSLLPAPSLCIDVGANQGDRTEAFRALGAAVVAVEPQPDCAARLRDRFADDSAVTVEETALGREPGTAPLHVATASTISSMSPDWIEAVRRSGRFEGYDWGETIEVSVTTLDALIEAYGLPDFVKIDVEGFEPEVLAGLGRPVPLLSFEYTAERHDAAVACLDMLEELGAFDYAFSEGESMVLGPWRSAGHLERQLRSAGDPRLWGDVYARQR